MQPIFKSFLDACEAAGIPCDIVQGTRTFDEQQTTYDQGRTAPGEIVTNAKPGDSFHQYGLAADVVPRAYKSMPDWNPEGPLWAKIGAIGESFGLQWGGRWATPDKPHFQFPGAPLQELKAYWEKFKRVMPINVTPGATAIVAALVIAALFWLVVKPQLERHGIL